MTLGSRIRQRRRALGLSQQEIATAIGVTPQGISLIEQDKRAPALASLAGIAEELAVTVDFLLTGKQGKAVITPAIPAIRADKWLSLRTKRALISLIEELYAGSPLE